MALEYDGAVHEDRNNVREDYRRQQDYAACDIALVTSQADDLRSARALERLMRLVALRLASCEEPGFMLLVEQALQDPSASSMRTTLLSQLLPSRPEGQCGWSALHRIAGWRAMPGKRRPCRLLAHFSAYTCAKLEEIGRGEVPCSRTSATQ